MERLAPRDMHELGSELAWVRRLAFALVRDAAAAEDISQEAWLAAHAHAPADRPLRPWLGTVVRNLVRMRLRSDARRLRREAAVTDETPPPTADELVDRVELQRALADAVLELDEPYRATVLLHYFEGLTSADIARRQGIPEGTVRRRLKVALDRLRARFEARDRRGVAAFAPLLAGPITMTKKTVLFLPLLLILILGVLGSVWWVRRDRDAAGASTTTTAAIRVQDIGHGSSGGTTPLTTSPERTPWQVDVRVPGRRIAGHVRFQGAPLPGATVRLADVTSESRGFRTGLELATAVSGPDGAFDLGVQPASTYVISAEAPDKTSAALAIGTANPKMTPSPDALVLELGSCGAKLYGSIVDASGGGVARARLSVAGLGGTEASATGEYALCVPMGDSRVRIVADGYGAIELPIHLVGAHRRDFELVPESVILGVVTDESGKGVPYAHVLAIPQAVEQPHFLGDGSAVADATGHFRLENLAPGRFLLAAAAEGRGSSAPTPAVAAPGTPAEVAIVVAQRAKITGTVMMKGQPVAGARIAAMERTLVTRSSYSQADGSFALDGVPLGTVRLDAGEYEIVSPASLAVDKTTLDKVIIEVNEGASLHGRVLRKGKPVADALVQSFSGPSTRSDSTGRYELKGLPPGDIQLYAQSFGDEPAFAPAAKVQIAPHAATEHDFDLTGAATVSGVVVDESGNPVPNVYVRLIEPKGDLGESMTDAKGAFKCTSMLGGADYRAAVFPSPGARTAFPPAGASYASFHLADGNAEITGAKIAIKHERKTITGRVVDDANQPVADVHVEAIGRGFGTNPSMLPSVRAAGDGTFSIGDLAPGSYLLHAHAADGSEVEMPDVVAGTTGVTLRLIRPGSIEGQLVGFDAPPRVHARQMTASLQIGNEAIVEGDHFTITGLTPGTYVVEALGAGRNAGQSVTVKPGAVTRVKLESQGQGRVRGTVTDFATGAPVPGMNCFAAQSMGGQAGDIVPGQNQPSAANATDASGAFDIPAPIGKARVMCFPGGNGTSVAGGDTDVAADRPGSIALETVKALPPPSDVGFRIKGLTLPLVIASVDADGPAKAAGLVAGDLVVSIDGASVAGLLPGGAMMLAWNHRPGSTLVLGVTRNGAPLSIKIPVKAPAN